MFVHHLSRASIKRSSKKHKSSKNKIRKPSKKLSRSNKRKSRKSMSKTTKGGGYILQVEGAPVGGQTPRMGYDQCCPPVYQNGNVAYNAGGNRMCGGSRKNNRKNSRKNNIKKRLRRKTNPKSTASKRN